MVVFSLGDGIIDGDDSILDSGSIGQGVPKHKVSRDTVLQLPDGSVINEFEIFSPGLTFRRPFLRVGQIPSSALLNRFFQVDFYFSLLLQGRVLV